MAKVKHMWLSIKDTQILSGAVVNLRNRLENCSPSDSAFTRHCRQSLKDHADRQASQPTYDYFIDLVNRLLQARSMGQVTFIFQTTIPPQLSV